MCREFGIGFIDRPHVQMRGSTYICHKVKVVAPRLMSALTFGFSDLITSETAIRSSLSNGFSEYFT